MASNGFSRESRSRFSTSSTLAFFTIPRPTAVMKLASVPASPGDLTTVVLHTSKAGQVFANVPVLLPDGYYSTLTATPVATTATSAATAGGTATATATATVTTTVTGSATTTAPTTTTSTTKTGG